MTHRLTASELRAQKEDLEKTLHNDPPTDVNEYRDLLGQIDSVSSLMVIRGLEEEEVDL